MPDTRETTPAPPPLKVALLIANLTEIAAEHRARGSLYQAACVELSLDLLKARADLIERLSSELQEAKEALKRIANVVGEDEPSIMWPWAQEIARSVLSPDKDQTPT